MFIGFPTLVTVNSLSEIFAETKFRDLTEKTREIFAFSRNYRSWLSLTDFAEIDLRS